MHCDDALEVHTSVKRDGHNDFWAKRRIHDHATQHAHLLLGVGLENTGEVDVLDVERRHTGKHFTRGIDGGGTCQPRIGTKERLDPTTVRTPVRVVETTFQGAKLEVYPDEAVGQTNLFWGRIACFTEIDLGWRIQVFSIIALGVLPHGMGSLTATESESHRCGKHDADQPGVSIH